MEHIVALLVLLIVLFGTVKPTIIQEPIPYVRHIDEFFDEGYFEIEGV